MKKKRTYVNAKERNEFTSLAQSSCYDSSNIELNKSPKNMIMNSPTNEGDFLPIEKLRFLKRKEKKFI